MNESLTRELAPKEAEVHTPRMRSLVGFQDDTSAAPPPPTNSLNNKYTNEKAESTKKFENFTSKRDLKPTPPSNTVQTPYGYVPHPQQTEPRQANSSLASPSSVSIPPPSPLIFVPLIPSHPTPGDNLLYQQNIRSISQNGSSSPATIPLRSSSSGPSADQAAQLPPPNSEHDTAPWVSAWRKLRAPKKRMDDQFVARMSDLRRQTAGTTSTVSTPQATQIGSPTPIASSTSFQSSSVASPPSTVEFPPTPVFTDQNPEGLMQTVKLVVPTRSVRRGYWNRRGDHLTSDGHLVFPPPSMQYPDDLKTYPKQGYRNHIGLYISYIRRPELPQSLPKDGKPPERPYESVSLFFC